MVDHRHEREREKKAGYFCEDSNNLRRQGEGKGFVEHYCLLCNEWGTRGSPLDSEPVESRKLAITQWHAVSPDRGTANKLDASGKGLLLHE